MTTAANLLDGAEGWMALPEAKALRLDAIGPGVAEMDRLRALPREESAAAYARIRSALACVETLGALASGSSESERPEGRFPLGSTDAILPEHMDLFRAVLPAARAAHQNAIQALNALRS